MKERFGGLPVVSRALYKNSVLITCLHAIDEIIIEVDNDDEAGFLIGCHLEVAGSRYDAQIKKIAEGT